MPCISQGGWGVFEGLKGLRGFRRFKGVERVFEGLREYDSLEPAVYDPRINYVRTHVQCPHVRVIDNW